jgi:hypothetical protein
MHRSTRWVALFAGLVAAAPAFATVSIPIPEPGMLELLAAGVVAGVIVWARNRRK